MSSFQPLKNILILDFSRLLPGPFCSYLLNEMGAKVRGVVAAAHPEVLHFKSLQGGKKKITLDLKNPKDLQKAKTLARRADVILEGFRPGVMDRLGLGFHEVKKINSKIIFCSITGYGQKDCMRAGHDLNYLALSGLLKALSPQADLKIPGIPISDLVGGMSAALRVLAALSVPKQKRKAIHLDISMTEAAKSLLKPFQGPVGETLKNMALEGYARYQLYLTQDQQYLAVAPLEEKFWEKFKSKMQIPDQTLQAGEAKTIQWLKKRFKEKAQKEWLVFLDDPDFCVTPVID